MKHCSVSLHNMKHSLRSYDEKMKNESWSNPLPWRTLIRIKSPKNLRCKRSPDLRRRKKIGQSTLQCYVLLPPNGANRLSPSNRSIFSRSECYQGMFIKVKCASPIIFKIFSVFAFDKLASLVYICKS
jgi:hypothetical protein